MAHDLLTSSQVQQIQTLEIPLPSQVLFQALQTDHSPLDRQVRDMQSTLQQEITVVQIHLHSDFKMHSDQQPQIRPLEPSPSRV